MNRRPSVMPPRESMAPGGMAAQSKVAMAAELEKTEQSITIALQGIDRNFAKANRIVGESILPVIERYTQQSRTLWGGAEFWKSFLESAANVKLSGYEEDVHPEQHEQTAVEEDDNTPQFESEVIAVKAEDDTTELGLDFSEPETQSTPHVIKRPGSPTKIPRPVSMTPKMTPRRDQFLDDDEDESMLELTPTVPRSKGKTPKSILRHQVLDKHWGIQATPIKKEASNTDDLSFSPAIEPPKTNFITSPKDESTSMMTPQKLPKQRSPFTPKYEPSNRDDGSDSDFEMGMSPPVTMHFGGANIVRREALGDLSNQIVRTPARQAAQYLVDDLFPGDDSSTMQINASITKTHYSDYLLDDDST